MPLGWQSTKFKRPSHIGQKSGSCSEYYGRRRLGRFDLEFWMNKTILPCCNLADIGWQPETWSMPSRSVEVSGTREIGSPTSLPRLLRSKCKACTQTFRETGTFARGTRLHDQRRLVEEQAVRQYRGVRPPEN